MREDTLVLTNVVEKKCGRCHQMVPIGRFYRKKSSPDGFQAVCVDCEREYKSWRTTYSYIRQAKLKEVHLGEILSTAKAMDGKDRTDLANMLERMARSVRKLK